MKWDIRVPCKSCPYRKDTKLGLWSAQEFIDLQINDQRDDPGAPLYACHGTAKLPEPTICAGWLMDQRRRHVDNIGLRLTLALDEDALACYLEVDCEAEMFGSIEEMADANYEAIFEDGQGSD